MKPDSLDASPLVSAISGNLAGICRDRAALVAISGIDGSGKSTISKLLAEQLQARSYRVAVVNIDPWHHPQSVRFSKIDPAEHFYHNAFRWDELFEKLLLPLKRTRSVQLSTQVLDLPTDTSYPYTFDFQKIDVILFEGIFILQSHLKRHYDLACWVECTYETAVERALVRNQEGLSEAELTRDFKMIYFPAERFHIERDDPKSIADVIVVNDHRIAAQTALPVQASAD